MLLERILVVSRRLSKRCVSSHILEYSREFLVHDMGRFPTKCMLHFHSYTLFVIRFTFFVFCSDVYHTKVNIL